MYSDDFKPWRNDGFNDFCLDDLPEEQLQSIDFGQFVEDVESGIYDDVQLDLRTEQDVQNRFLRTAWLIQRRASIEQYQASFETVRARLRFSVNQLRARIKKFFRFP